MALIHSQAKPPDMLRFRNSVRRFHTRMFAHALGLYSPSVLVCIIRYWTCVLSTWSMELRT